MEIYKVISDYPNYEISNLGNVRNRKRNTILSPAQWGNGYWFVQLWKDGVSKGCSIHRLLAQSFIPNPENKKEVNHINGIKTDNRLENLEWVTHSENAVHSYEVLKNKSVGPNKQKVRCIETGQEFESINEASRHFNCNSGTMWKIIHKGWGYKQFHFELV